MIKINSKKKILVVCLCVIGIICSIIISNKIIDYYNNSIWISYRYDDSEFENNIGNQGSGLKYLFESQEEYFASVKRNGKITLTHRESFGIKQFERELNEEELEELKELVKKFKSITKKSKYDEKYKNGIKIDNDFYLFSNLNTEQRILYARVERIILKK